MNGGFHSAMTITWRLVLVIGFASSAIALDANYVADKVIASLNASHAALAAHASEWFSLPGFNISFNNKNESKWHFLNGKFASVGEIKLNEEPQVVQFLRDGPSVLIPVDVKNVVINYTFSCSDFFVISGYSYSISRTVSTQATIIVDITSDSPSQCQGQVHSTPSSFSYEDDGSDFGKITPDDQYAKQCIMRSYNKTQEYTDLINNRFLNDYGDAVERFLASATNFALTNLNLCSQ